MPTAQSWPGKCAQSACAQAPWRSGRLLQTWMGACAALLSLARHLAPLFFRPSFPPRSTQSPHTQATPGSLPLTLILRPDLGCASQRLRGLRSLPIHVHLRAQRADAAQLLPLQRHARRGCQGKSDWPDQERHGAKQGVAAAAARDSLSGRQVGGRPGSGARTAAPFHRAPCASACRAGGDHFPGDAVLCRCARTCQRRHSQRRLSVLGDSDLDGPRRQLPHVSTGARSAAIRALPPPGPQRGEGRKEGSTCEATHMPAPHLRTLPSDTRAAARATRCNISTSRPPTQAQRSR